MFSFSRVNQCRFQIIYIKWNWNFLYFVISIICSLFLVWGNSLNSYIDFKIICFGRSAIRGELAKLPKGWSRVTLRQRLQLDSGLSLEPAQRLDSGAGEPPVPLGVHKRWMSAGDSLVPSQERWCECCFPVDPQPSVLSWLPSLLFFLKLFSALFVMWFYLVHLGPESSRNASEQFPFLPVALVLSLSWVLLGGLLDPDFLKSFPLFKFTYSLHCF